MKIEPGRTYYFTKSGNQVKTVAPAEPYLGQPCWSVVRTDGESAGKGMIVPASALVNEMEKIK